MTRNQASIVAASGMIVLIGVASFYDNNPVYVDNPMQAIKQAVDTRPASETLPIVLPIEKEILPTLTTVVDLEGNTEPVLEWIEIDFEGNTEPVLEWTEIVVEEELPALEGEV